MTATVREMENSNLKQWNFGWYKTNSNVIAMNENFYRLVLCQWVWDYTALYVFWFTDWEHHGSMLVDVLRNYLATEYEFLTGNSIELFKVMSVLILYIDTKIIHWHGHLKNRGMIQQLSMYNSKQNLNSWYKWNPKEQKDSKIQFIFKHKKILEEQKENFQHLYTNIFDRYLN